MTCRMVARRMAAGIITLATLLAVHVGGTAALAEEDLKTAVLRELPPIRLHMSAVGWVFDEQVRATMPLLKDKIIAAGIELTSDDAWPPTDDYGLALQIDARIDELTSGCAFVVRTNLTEYARPVRRTRKIEGVDAAKLARVISWRGPRLIAYSDMGQSDCWALCAKLAIRGVDEFIEDYRAANPALPRDSTE